MKIAKSVWQTAWLSAVLVMRFGCVGTIHSADTEATNSTQALLQQRGFREGLLWIGTNEPSEVESRRLLEIVKNLDKPSWRGEVEQFLQEYASSPWAASLHHAYASFCRRTGRTTKALEHWEAGWALVKNETPGQGKLVGGAILAEWTELLSSLGRLEKLKELVAAGDQWGFANRQQREKFLRAKDSYYLMQIHPGLAYRCGTLALKAVGQALQPTNKALEVLVDLPSPTNGFSLAALVEMADQHGLNLVAVRRATGQELVVPSVVHWRQNHYASILEQGAAGYLVADPTFGRPKWLPLAVINEEASGVFLIPSSAHNPGWTSLNRSEVEAIHGKGLPNYINDGQDKGCRRSFSGQTECPPCTGMPVWWVSEPYINSWIADEPINYLTSRGEPFPFRLTYKQRDTRPDNPYSPFDHVPVAGWNHNWFSYIRLDATEQCAFGTCTFPTFQESEATLYLPNGGEVFFPKDQRYDKESRIRLEPVTTPPNVVLQGGNDDGKKGLRVIHADGSQEIYGFGLAEQVPSGDYAQADFLLTRRIDPHGNTTRFYYETVGTIMQRLKYVVDYDGRTNTLSYTTTTVTNMLLAQVQSPYGNIAYFKYDSNKNLTNIIDAADLSTTLKYDTNDYPASLITPYGTNQIEYMANTTTGQGNFGGHDLISRAIRVTEPTGGTQLYLYRYDSPFMPTNYPAGEVPVGTPLGTLDSGTGGTNTLSAVSFRNSFYWNARQYASLSTTNLTAFTPNDYLRGRMRHWLQDTNELFLSGLMSIERNPSPDGTAEGLKFFYDFEGKIYRHRMGTNALPAVMAWRLPGAETQYEYMRFNEFGFITNRVTTFTKTDGSAGTRTNQFLYAANGYTNTSTILAQAYSITNVYSIPNLLTRITEADGSNVWNFGFDVVSWTNDFVISGPDTNRVIFTSKRILPRSITNGVNEVTELAFASFNKIAGIKWPTGLTTTNLYNSGGFLWRTIDLEIGRTNSFGYTTNGLVSNHTNELGVVSTNTWDALLRLTASSDSLGSFSNRYDKLDLVAVKDRLNNWTYGGYDGLRHLNSITNALTKVTRLSWCNCGTLETITDALTNITSFQFDNQVRRTNVVFADGSSQSYRYDLAGRTTNVLDGAGRSFKLSYNNQGLVTAVSNAFGPVLRVLYDIRDRPVQVTDAAAVTVTNTFDNLDRIIRRDWPDGGVERSVYSAAGLIAYTNQLGQPTRYGYDPGRRLIALTNANQEIIRATYDSADNLLTLIDGKSQTTTWSNDVFGRTISKRDALNNLVQTNAYDANDRLTARWTPAKGITSYTWDAGDNLRLIDYPNSRDVTLTYDAVNRLTNMTDIVGESSFGYEPSGQLQSEDGPWSSDTISYDYLQQQRRSLSLLQPSANPWSQTYTYDTARRLQSLLTPLGTFTYTLGGASSASPLIKKLTLPNGAYITNHYDSLARLGNTALVNRWGNVLDGYGYTHDTWGQRTNITRNFGLASSTVALTYDKIGQLKTAKGYEADATPRLNEQLGFDYDAAGNLQHRTNNTYVQNAYVQTFNVNALNELTTATRSGQLTVAGAVSRPASSVTVNGLTAGRYADNTYASSTYALTNGDNTFTIVAQATTGQYTTNVLIQNLPATVTFQYDANGNLTNDGLRSFSFDDENQLTNITVIGQWKADFVYDGFGRRRISKDYGWQTGQWVKTNEVRYIYDFNLVIQERDSNNVPLVTYTRGLDLSSTRQGAGGIGGLLARTDATGSAFYHSDGSGNVTAILDTQQHIVARYLYDPFGNLVGKWGSLADVNRYRFSSKEVHSNSRLYYYGFRYYAPNLQRWLNQDPIWEAGGINLHRFVFNDPVDWFDTDGLAPSQARSSPPRGSITEEILGGLNANSRTGRGGRIPDAEERFHGQSRRNAQEEYLRQRFSDHKPGQSYLGQGSLPPAKPAPCPPSSLSNQNAPPSTTITGPRVHRNSLDYVGDTHVYRIRGPEGTYKIGESAQGTRVSDDASIRAEQQVRRLLRENGPGFESEIRKTFGSKANARDYEGQLIERFRRIHGDDALPGNKNNR